MRSKIIFTLLIIAALITFNSCNHNPVSPSQPQPGRRDYTWTVDTVVSPENYDFKTLYRLWASSPTDVWATGFGGDAAADIFHFDGKKWVSSGERYEGKYLLPGYEPSSIYGFGPNDVYIGCDQGRIYRFDGSGMKESASLTKDGHSDIVFDNMWGDNPNDLYATGAYPDSQGLFNGSVIARYLFNKWTILNTDGIKGIVERFYRDKDNKIYLRTTRMGGGKFHDSTLIYEYSSRKEIFSSAESQGLQADLSIINGEVYFILGNEIAIRKNDQFRTVLKVNNSNFNQRIWGRNSKDIFLEMTNGLAHYNGTDIKYLFHYNQNTYIYSAAIFMNNVFFLENSSQGLSLVYHGILKQ